MKTDIETALKLTEWHTGYQCRANALRCELAYMRKQGAEDTQTYRDACETLASEEGGRDALGAVLELLGVQTFSQPMEPRNAIACADNPARKREVRA